MIETNLYGYSFSDPINFIDPNGMFGENVAHPDDGNGTWGRTERHWICQQSEKCLKAVDTAFLSPIAIYAISARRHGNWGYQSRIETGMFASTSGAAGLWVAI